MDRENIIVSFLENNGCRGFDRVKIPGDASFRRYERITGSESMILMDAPPPKEDVKPFLKIANILQRMNLSSPRIYGIDVANGLLLLEDLGNDRFANIFTEKPSLQSKLYRQAVDVLAAIRNRGGEYEIDEYSADLMLNEADLFTDWYLPMHSKLSGTDLKDVKLKYRELILDVLLNIDNDKKVLVLRDYHSENLMHLPGRENEKAVGLLDFQDAVIGHPAYDLASLLEDARRDVPKDLAEEIINYYLDLFPKTDREQFMDDYYALAAIRNLKILGIFSRLKARDGKDIYLKHIPRVMNYLKEDLKNEKLKELREFLISQCNI